MKEIELTPLDIIDNDKGEVLHVIKRSNKSFYGFGEAYFSKVNLGDIKGWKKHKRMTLNLVVPVGEIKFVIYNEISNEFFSVNLSNKNYKRLTVRPGLWVAFKGLEENNILLNVADMEHDKSEAVNLALNEIPYEWS